MAVFNLTKHRVMWDWLSENPTKHKTDWLEDNEPEDASPCMGCYACDYAVKQPDISCNQGCPFQIEPYSKDCLNGLYRAWLYSSIDDKAYFARLIRDFPVKAGVKTV